MCGLVCPQHQWQFHWGQGRVACFLFHISIPPSTVQHHAGHSTETPEMFQAELTSCSLSISVKKKVPQSCGGKEDASKKLPQFPYNTYFYLPFIECLLWMPAKFLRCNHQFSQQPTEMGFYNSPRLEGQGREVDNEASPRQSCALRTRADSTVFLRKRPGKSPAALQSQEHRDLKKGQFDHQTHACSRC